jgi:DNA-binding beta-propeller fold protein YncE
VIWDVVTPRALLAFVVVLVLSAGISVVVFSRDDEVPRVRTDTIEVGRLPTDLALAGDELWIAHAGERRLLSIDPRRSGRPEVHRLDFPVLRVSARGPSVWASGPESDALVGLREHAPRIITHVPVGRDAVDVAVTEDAVWVTNGSSGTVTRLDPLSGRQLGGPIRTGRFPSALAVGAGYVWVVNSGDGTVARVDPREDVVVGRRLRVGADPQAIAVGLGSVWVANRGDGTVTRLAAATGRPIGQPILVGGEPTALAVTTDGILVLDSRDRWLLRLDRAGRVRRLAGLRGFPGGLAVDRTGAAWVVDTRSGTLTRVTAGNRGGGRG